MQNAFYIAISYWDHCTRTHTKTHAGGSSCSVQTSCWYHNNPVSWKYAPVSRAVARLQQPSSLLMLLCRRFPPLAFPPGVQALTNMYWIAYSLTVIGALTHSSSLVDACNGFGWMALDWCAVVIKCHVTTQVKTHKKKNNNTTSSKLDIFNCLVCFN